MRIKGDGGDGKRTCTLQKDSDCLCQPNTLLNWDRTTSKNASPSLDGQEEEERKRGLGLNTNGSYYGLLLLHSSP